MTTLEPTDVLVVGTVAPLRNPVFFFPEKKKGMDIYIIHGIGYSAPTRVDWDSVDIHGLNNHVTITYDYQHNEKIILLS